MKRTIVFFITGVFVMTTFFAKAQNSAIEKIFPANTVFHRNLPYAKGNNKKQLLDIYLPAKQKGKFPLVIWIHGGAWMLNDKYADMGYMKNTVKGFIDSGYALASIDYRHSTEAVFPAQMQDCNEAIEYLYQHAEVYNIDKNKIALVGFSAGGHLASLLGLSHNNNVKDFYAEGTKPGFSIKCIIDFYGPSDLIAISSSTDTLVNNNQSPVAVLLGAMPLKRPDIAQKASPVTYIDKNDPPFIIVQGEKDESVPNTQSILLSSWLNINGVTNKLTIVPGAPHYGEMFDVESIRNDLFAFLSKYLK